MPDEIADKQEELKRLQIIKSKLEREQELKLKVHLLGLYQESRIVKDQVAMHWPVYAQFIRGMHWPKRRPSHKISAVLNFVIDNIERKTALLTDAKPIPHVAPRTDKYQDTADIINSLINIIFQGSEFGQSVTDMVQNAQVFGCGFMGTLFDKSANHGKGDITTVSYDPRAVYIDPLVMKSYLLAQGEYVILEDVWSLERAKDLFPKVADRIKPEAGLSPFRDQGEQSLFGKIRARVLRTHRQDPSTSAAVPRVYVREFYLKDYAKGASGSGYRFNNQCRRSIMINDVIAYDGDNPYKDGEFPIDMMIWHTDLFNGYGWGDVELLKSPQEVQNKLIATILENIILMSNAIWIGDADALSKEEWIKLNNAPGSNIKKRPGRELRREPGMAIPPHVIDTLQYVGMSTEKITGMVDVMQGIRTGQVSSGVGIESLQLMAQALIRLRARALESLQTRVGKKLISRIFQFYKPKKIFEILSAHDVDYGEQMKTITTDLLKATGSRDADTASNVIFRIEPGSSLELAKTQRRIESMRLRELNIIDDQALLEDLDYPHREKVLKRVGEKRQDEEDTEIQPPGPPDQGGKQFPGQSGASPAGRF